MKNRLPSVSTIVIARNEEEHIEKCLDAAVREAERVGADVVFVDCASTDRTIEIASGFPVKVVKMSPDSILTAAAARMVGLMNSTGEFIVFVDGDCVLESGWVNTAISVLEEDRSSAAVRGRLDEVYICDGTVIGEEEDPLNDTSDRISETQFVGGNAVYRRNALENVGGFNPYIRSLEEPELCFRLMNKGLRILSVPEKMATHYTEKRWTFRQTVARFSSGLCLGYGQVLRSAMRNGFVWRFVIRENRTFVFFIACLLGILSVINDLFVGSPMCLVSWGFFMLSVFAYIALKNKSLRWAAILYLTWFLNCVSIFDGLLRRLPDASGWHPHYTIVEAGTHTGDDTLQEMEPSKTTFSSRKGNVHV